MAKNMLTKKINVHEAEEAILADESVGELNPVWLHGVARAVVELAFEAL